VGCLYKILAKVLANRLRQVISTVIYEAQSAFVKDRQILDDILIANEVVDFEKAYDYVDLGYLDDVTGRMMFPTLWQKWMKECVGTTTSSVFVNGCPISEFPMKRGVKTR